MPKGSKSSFLCIKYVSLGFFNGRKSEEIKKIIYWKKKIYVAIFFFLTVLVILYLLYTHPTKIMKSKKVKRCVKFEEMDDHPGNILKSKTDVEIVSENLRSTTPPNQHPNHRYPEEKLSQNKKKIEQRSDRPSTKALNYSKIKQQPIKGRKKEEGKSDFVNELLKVSGPSLRLKGIYMKPEDNPPSRQSNDQLNYSREINKLIEQDTDLETNEGKLSLKKALPNNGIPFHLPGQILHHRKKSNHQNFLRKPITIYLDFYPMQDEHFKKRRFKNKQPFVPLENGKRMIMKLNLFPKKKFPVEHHERRTFDRHGQEVRSDYHKKAEKKSFGRFSIPKKLFRPHERHIKVKNINRKRVPVKRMIVKRF